MKGKLYVQERKWYYMKEKRKVQDRKMVCTYRKRKWYVQEMKMVCTGKENGITCEKNGMYR